MRFDSSSRIDRGGLNLELALLIMLLALAMVFSMSLMGRGIANRFQDASEVLTGGTDFGVVVSDNSATLTLSNTDGYDVREYRILRSGGGWSSWAALPSDGKITVSYGSSYQCEIRLTNSSTGRTKTLSESFIVPTFTADNATVAAKTNEVVAYVDAGEDSYNIYDQYATFYARKNGETYYKVQVVFHADDYYGYVPHGGEVSLWRYNNGVSTHIETNGFIPSFGRYQEISAQIIPGQLIVKSRNAGSSDPWVLVKTIAINGVMLPAGEWGTMPDVAGTAEFISVVRQ